MSVFGDIVKEVRYIDDKLYVSFDKKNYNRLELKLRVQENEIERLNNIINGLEKWLKEKQFERIDNVGIYALYETVLQKIQELKGSESNE